MSGERVFRVAILTDIHGNSIALEAVLQDIAARGGADETWVLGNLVALGHDGSHHGFRSGWSTLL